MSDFNFSGQFKSEDYEVKLHISVLSFKDGGVNIIYAPALDVYGTGNNLDEAKQSFEVSVSEFFKYTLNKNTLKTELKRLGWKINGSNKNLKIAQPNLADMLNRNGELKEIMENKSYKHFNKSISIPAFA